MSYRQIARTVTDFATVLEAIHRRQVGLAKAGQAVEDAQVQLAILLRALDARQTEFSAFVTMSRWQRLRWLVVGR